MRFIKFALIVLLVLAVPVFSTFGCASHIRPTVTLQPAYPLDANTPIFLSAQRQRARILKSLNNAGFRTARARADTPYFLIVKIGKTRTRKDCGIVANVSYDLRDSNRHITVLKGRGATGNCEPNILDAMSVKLASLKG